MNRIKDEKPVRVTMPGLNITLGPRHSVSLFRGDDGSFIWLFSRPDGAKQVGTELRISEQALKAMVRILKAHEANPIGQDPKGGGA